MRQYLLMVGGTIAFVLVAGWLMMPATSICANVINDAMGNHVSPGPTGHILTWDQACKSGMKWVKK